MPFYFQGYRILSILLPGIWDTLFNIFVTSKDIENLGTIIVGIFADLLGIFAFFFKGYGIFGTPNTSLISLFREIPFSIL